MTATITINEAGQINLPEALSRVFGLKPGVRVQAEVTLGKIEIVQEVPEISKGVMEKGVLVLPRTSRPDFLARQKAVFGGSTVADSQSTLDELRAERF